jgi:hypothetical protein
MRKDARQSAAEQFDPTEFYSGLCRSRQVSLAGLILYSLRKESAAVRYERLCLSGFTAKYTALWILVVQFGAADTRTPASQVDLGGA